MKKALIAMSGGVDSSVAAALMKDAGYECAGVTMKLFQNEGVAVSEDHSCCTLDDIADARQVAEALGMTHEVVNFSNRFRECVIDRFVYAYEHGMTPNPCVDCNRFLKFDALFRRAKETGFDLVVTGHYARVEKDDTTGRYLLKKASDPTKDQSYVLYTLSQEQLSHVQFPLGGMSKQEAREVAEKYGFINADKPDSQDICFVQDGSYADFLEGYTGHAYPAGDFVDDTGRVLGRHKGIVRYTVGQRKGLGLALPAPLYVTRVDTAQNLVHLGPHEALFSTTLEATDINWIAVEGLASPTRLKAKVRYRQPEQWATVEQTGEDSFRVVFDEAQRAITKGQAVVLYDGDTVVGGGTITQTV